MSLGSETAAEILRHAALEADRKAELAAQRVLGVARRRSSGPFNSADLRSKDRPYATRHPRPLLDPSMVNVQSGSFRDAWRVKYVGPGFRQVVNDSPVADFLQFGTRTMVARPVAEATEREALRRFGWLGEDESLAFLAA